MTKLSFIFLLSFLFFISCSEEEKQLELFSPEAFAFSLDTNWEVNASVQVRGFSQKENDGLFELKLSYQLDLELPNGEVVAKVDIDKLNENNSENILDLGIDSQIELDSNFTAGKYKLTFIVEDNFSHQTAVISTEFDLAK